MWKVFGQKMTGAILNQKVKFASNIDVIAIRTWFIIFNDPDFTGIKLNIYSMRGNTPLKKLATSTNTFLKADICTLENGVKEIYFDFENFQARAGEYYGIVPEIEGYTPALDSYVAWKKAWPDPVYRLGLTLGLKSKLNSPFDLYFIGG